MAEPFYGYRRVHKQLVREGYAVGERAVRRILKALGGSRSVGQVKVRTTDSRHHLPRYPNRIKGVPPNAINHNWVADITYVRLHRDFVYLAVIMDVFTQAVRGWHLSRSLDRMLTLTALQRALTYRVPVIHHSDQGWPYACDDYIALLNAHEIQISMAAVGKPEEHGYAERLMRTITEEEVDLSEYEDFGHA